MSGAITEASNSISDEIDVASPLGIVSILEQCDREIFDGFEDYKSLFHNEVVGAIETVSGHVEEILTGDVKNSIVVFSGCGTSGRIGFIAARTFNQFQQLKQNPQVFKYLIAGGDKALFTSQEAPEDDPYAGVEALKKVSEGNDHVLFIGITCGLSAPYVAGQLEYCMDNPGFTPVLVGFNPENLARNINIEKWDKTFLQVVNRLKTFSSSSRSGFIINPVVGPEPITGSSRMKSGSATKVILETICMSALCNVYNPGAKIQITDLIKCYQVVCNSVYKQKSELSQIVASAGESLQSEGNIYYLGNDSLALMGLIDASECPPTYGASLDDVRGFVDQGYATLQNVEGDLSDNGKHFRISLDDFCSDIAPSEKDIIIVLNSEKCLNLPEKCLKNGSKKILITFEKVTSSDFNQILHIEIPNEINELIGPEASEVANQMLQEIAVKWCLNAITTGAHVIKGKVYRNIMIDVRVSNNKLFHRAVGILERLGQMTKATATEYLLRSIYNVESITDDITSRSIAQHIATASDKDKVVPAALVSAVSQTTITDAKLALSRQPVIRTAIAEALKSLK